MNDLQGWDGLAAVTWSHLRDLEGFLKDIETGAWGGSFADAQQQRDVEGILAALGEHARFTRMALSAAISAGATQAALQQPLANLADSIDLNAKHQLPFNRKERYFTGTVLPAIIASDGFAHLQRFLDVCEVPHQVWPNLDGDQSFQFFTEYSFKESRTESDHNRFPDPVPGGDTPDLVIADQGWMLAVEAKMFHRPTRPTLQGQLTKQRKLMAYIARGMQPPVTELIHVALLPQALKDEVEMQSGSPRPEPLANVHTVTWEKIAAEYRNVAPRYWLAQLDYAIAQYNELASDNTYGKNADGVLTGWDIYQGYRDHNPEVTQYTYMGRDRGLGGPAMQKKDLVDDQWKKQHYEVRRFPREQANWFPIQGFLALLPSNLEQ